ASLPFCEQISPFRGAQAASLLFAAACREPVAIGGSEFFGAVGAAADCCRLAACAPQTLPARHPMCCGRMRGAIPPFWLAPATLLASINAIRRHGFYHARN